MSLTQNIELTLFSISAENSLFKIFIFITGDLVDLKFSNRYVDNIIPNSIKYISKFSEIAVNFKSQSLFIFLPIDAPRSTKSYSDLQPLVPTISDAVSSVELVFDI